MQVAIHLGAHCTDEDRLLRTLLQNKGLLAAEGISVPGPGRYRDDVVKAAQKLRGNEASRDTQAMLKESILDDDKARRAILSFDSFLCVPGRIFDGAILYEKASYKALWLRNLFPADTVEFFLGIRNPATFVPAAFRHKGQNRSEFRNFLQSADPTEMRWSDVIMALRDSNPDCALTVWCNEDTPLLWPQVLRAVSGASAQTKLEGAHALIKEIIHPAGYARMETYLAAHPPQNDLQARRIYSAFLERFAISDLIEEEIDVPGWSVALVEEMTAIYEEDLADIARLPGVQMMTA